MLIMEKNNAPKISKINLISIYFEFVSPFWVGGLGPHGIQTVFFLQQDIPYFFLRGRMALMNPIYQYYNKCTKMSLRLEFD